MTKNTEMETFQNSIRVFILLQQQQSKSLVQQSQSQQVFHILQERFKKLCDKHEFLKASRADGAKAR